MTGDKLRGALGLCRRAGKVTVGITLVKEQLHKEKAALVLLAADAAKNTEDRILPLAQHKAVPVHRVSLNKKELAAAVGKSTEAVCVSVPKEFVNLVLASL